MANRQQTSAARPGAKGRIHAAKVWACSRGRFLCSKCGYATLGDIILIYSVNMHACEYTCNCQCAFYACTHTQIYIYTHIYIYTCAFPSLSLSFSLYAYVSMCMWVHARQQCSFLRLLTRVTKQMFSGNWNGSIAFFKTAHGAGGIFINFKEHRGFNIWLLITWQLRCCSDPSDYCLSTTFGEEKKIHM